MQNTNAQPLVKYSYCWVLGVIRLPALLTTGLSLHEVGCERYEIATCEPLHDIKNTIHNVLSEMPARVANTQLKAEIQQFCENVLGRRQPFP